MNVRPILIAIICFQFALGFGQPAQAQLGGGGSNAFLDYLDKSTGPSDYVVKRFPNQKLIPTRLIGGVQRPGFYQIPENTSLLSLMSYSGGATPTSDISSVVIWRQESKQSIKIDLDQILHSPTSADPIIMPNDVIYIREKEQWISNNIVTLLMVTSTLTAIILAGYSINDRQAGRYFH